MKIHQSKLEIPKVHCDLWRPCFGKGNLECLAEVRNKVTKDKALFCVFLRPRQSVVRWGIFCFLFFAAKNQMNRRKEEKDRRRRREREKINAT